MADLFKTLPGVAHFDTLRYKPPSFIITVALEKTEAIPHFLDLTLLCNKVHPRTKLDNGRLTERPTGCPNCAQVRCRRRVI